jgi:hypothetical protein
MKHNKRKKQDGNEENQKDIKIGRRKTYDIGKEPQGEDKGTTGCRIKMDIEKRQSK